MRICPMENIDMRKIRHDSIEEKQPECTDKRPFLCDTCGITFTLKHLLVRHKLRHRRNPIIVKCSECDKNILLEVINVSDISEYVSKKNDNKDNIGSNNHNFSDPTKHNIAKTCDTGDNRENPRPRLSTSSNIFTK